MKTVNLFNYYGSGIDYENLIRKAFPDAQVN